MKDQEYDYFYDDEQDAKYCYPGTNVLKNKLDIKDLDTLHEAERDYSAVRQAELVGQGVTGDSLWIHDTVAGIAPCEVSPFGNP